MQLIVQESNKKGRLILKELSTNDINFVFVWLFKPRVTLA